MGINLSNIMSGRFTGDIPCDPGPCREIPAPGGVDGNGGGSVGNEQADVSGMSIPKFDNKMIVGLLLAGVIVLFLSRGK